jgi:hypothetical protein
MSQRKQKYIAVVGGYECTSSDAALAEQVGELIARAGAVVVTGGRLGITEAACKGAKKAGGMTIGILPGKDYREANEFVDHAICTGIGEARNTCIVMTADGVIALPGKFGTLSEIAFALLNNRPVVSLNSWDVAENVIKVSTAAEAVERILKEVGK